jgi:hypothetical protein
VREGLGQRLAVLDLEENPIFKGANITIRAKPAPANADVCVVLGKREGGVARPKVVHQIHPVRVM